MPDPRELLICLLDYIKEQTKEVNPEAFRLSTAKGFQRQRNDLAGLPGVDFDIKVTGDHIWLRVPRLAAEPPPLPPRSYKGILRFNTDPSGPPPLLDAPAFMRQINSGVQAANAKGLDPTEVAQTEARQRASAASALNTYSIAWKSWAAGERPRRSTISLYGDLFALMHQMEAEQTSKPQEIVWGMGISSWILQGEKDKVSFEYPLLTQAMEITIDDRSMAVELRPRATDTRIELDALVACRVAGAIEVERDATAHLAKNKDKPVSPFDPGSYTDVLKLIAGNLDSEGQYKEILTQGGLVPQAGKDLTVTDGWVLLSRPRAVNYLFEDLKRLQEKLEDGCELFDGPLALVTPPSDQPLEFEAISFRGLSGRGSGGGSAIEELYFPLPYNAEQVTIGQKLNRAAGVTVQGPPGTGKTHTIANVISHFLASGKRVLAPSRGEGPLSVLKDTIPQKLPPTTPPLSTTPHT